MPPVNVDAHANKLMEDAKRLSTDTFDKSIAYNNVIILAAYGGLFSLLNATEDYISRDLKILVSVFLLISLLFFVSFTLFQVFLMARQTFFYSVKILDDAEKMNVMVGADNSDIEKAKKNMKAQMKVWTVSASISVLSGMCAAVILLFVYVCNIIS